MATIKFWKLRLHFLHFVREHSHRLSPFFKSDISPRKPALLSRTADTVRLVQGWFVLFAHQFGSSEFPGSFKHYFAPINVTMAYFQVHLPPGSKFQCSVATTSLGEWWPQADCVTRRSEFDLRDLTRGWCWTRAEPRWSRASLQSRLDVEVSSSLRLDQKLGANRTWSQQLPTLWPALVPGKTHSSVLTRVPAWLFNSRTRAEQELRGRSLSSRS